MPMEERIGEELARYGPFRIYEVRRVLPNGQVFRTGHLYLMADAEAGAIDATSMSLIPIELRRTDIAVVLRHLRLLLRSRRHTLNILRVVLRDAQRRYVAFVFGVQLPGRDEYDEDSTIESLWADVERLEAELETAQRIYDRIDHAWRDLEAAHSDLNLEPVDETITPDPELVESIKRAWKQQHSQNAE